MIMNTRVMAAEDSYNLFQNKLKQKTVILNCNNITQYYCFTLFFQ